VVLEWSRTPAEVLVALIELNNTYALDGRDPNSYSGGLTWSATAPPSHDAAGAGFDTPAHLR
jgi:hypothetical protein